MSRSAHLVLTMLLTAILSWIASDTYREWQIQRESETWPSVLGTIERSEVLEHRSTSSSNRPVTRFYADVNYGYRVEGVNYRSDRIWVGNTQYTDRAVPEGVVQRYPPGASVRVFYQRNDPSQSLLEPGVRGTQRLWVAALLPFLGFVIVCWLDGLLWPFGNRLARQGWSVERTETSELVVVTLRGMSRPIAMGVSVLGALLVVLLASAMGGLRWYPAGWPMMLIVALGLASVLIVPPCVVARAVARREFESAKRCTIGVTPEGVRVTRGSAQPSPLRGADSSPFEVQTLGREQGRSPLGRHRVVALGSGSGKPIVVCAVNSKSAARAIARRLNAFVA